MIGKVTKAARSLRPACNILDNKVQAVLLHKHHSSREAGAAWHQGGLQARQWGRPFFNTFLASLSLRSLLDLSSFLDLFCFCSNQ